MSGPYRSATHLRCLCKDGPLEADGDGFRCPKGCGLWDPTIPRPGGTSLAELGRAIEDQLRPRTCPRCQKKMQIRRWSRMTFDVCAADDHAVAVRIDVTQHGTEDESSGSYSYKWTETGRAIIVRPFYLELADGTRVRVLAPKNVQVADALDQKVLISNTVRKLSAELVPGETLHAQGWLERGSTRMPGGETRESGYRDATYEWQLVPTVAACCCRRSRSAGAWWRARSFMVATRPGRCSYSSSVSCCCSTSTHVRERRPRHDRLQGSLEVRN